MYYLYIYVLIYAHILFIHAIHMYNMCIRVLVHKSDTAFVLVEDKILFSVSKCNKTSCHSFPEKKKKKSCTYGRRLAHKSNFGNKTLGYHDISFFIYGLKKTELAHLLPKIAVVHFSCVNGKDL